MTQSTRLKSTLAHIRWAFGITHSTCPWLFIAFAINALVLIIFPAGIALSIRGLVNSVSEAIAGTPLDQTSADFWLLFSFAMTVGSSVSHATNRYFARRFEIELRHRLNLDILNHHQAMSFIRLEQQSYRNSLKRAQRNPEQHVTNLYAFSLDLFTKTLQIGSLMVILFAIEPRLFLFLLPVGIPFLIFQWRLSRRQFDELDSRVKKERWMGYYSGLLNDSELAGEIKLFRLGAEFIQRWEQIMAEFCDLRLNYQWLEFIGNLLFALFSVAAIYLALDHAMESIVDGQRTIGDLAIFVSAAAQLRALIERSVTLTASLRWQLLNVAQLREFFQIEVEKKAIVKGPTADLAGKIEFRNVSFRYPATSIDILNDLSFTIAAGETVALVGANGAGKSTVAKLICGFYQPQHGTILFDDQDVAELDPAQRQRQIAAMFQQFGRYMATAADTIAFGDWQTLQNDQAAIEAIAKKAHVDQLINAMPQQYQTLLGRQFSEYQPSGGQWQQLAIARLIAHDARILILDEPTASLDVATEAELFQQFSTLSAGRTTLLISHRFSTVSIADRILLIDDGQIIESGSHQALLYQNGRYAALFALAQRFTESP